MKKTMFTIATLHRENEEVINLGRGFTTVLLDTSDGKFDCFITDDEAKKINCPLVNEGDRVFDFSKARNAVAELSKTDWIISLDADEVLEADKEKIEAIMSQPDVAAIRCVIDDGVRKWSNVRTYVRTKAKWKDTIHEYVEGIGKTVDVPEDVMKIVHHQKPSTERKSRAGSLALQALREPTARHLFYWGRELTYNGLWKEAIETLEKAVPLIAWKEEKAQALTLIGDCRLCLGDKETAKAKWLEAYNASPNRRIGLLRLAKLAYVDVDWPTVVRFAAPAMEIARSPYVEDNADFGVEPHIWLYVALWQTGNIEASRKHYKIASEIEPNNEKVLNDRRWFVQQKISIVIPTLGRPEKLERCLNAIKENADWPHEVIVEHDSFEDRQGCPKTLAKGVEKATGDFVMFLGNDCIPQKGFLSEAMKAMNAIKDGWGLVALYDKRHQGALATHWLASKRLLSLLDGYFFHPDYEHCWCDVELTERTKALGRYAYAPTSVVVHDNAIVDGGECDEVLKIAYDKDRLERDRATYERRKAVWSLPFTGERVVPDKMDIQPQTLAEHLARYEFAKGRVIGRVLDAPCGTGYGSDIIGADGCDVSEEALAYAKAKYPDRKFFRCNLENPSIGETYDTVVSFEGLEHLNDPKPFIEEVRHKATRKFIFSIPVNNPSQWHKQVYSVEQIKNLFGRFRNVEWFEQTGTEIRPLEKSGSPTFIIGVADTQ